MSTPAASFFLIIIPKEPVSTAFFPQIKLHAKDNHVYEVITHLTSLFFIVFYGGDFWLTSQPISGFLWEGFSPKITLLIVQEELERPLKEYFHAAVIQAEYALGIMVYFL
jgi:hypothetical protein